MQRRKVTNSKNAILAAHDEGFCNAYVCTAKIYNKKYNPKGRNKFGFEIFLSLLVWYSAMKNIWIKQSAAAVHIFQPNFHFWNVPAFFPIPSIFMCKHSPMCFVMSRQKCVKTKQLHLTPFLIVPTLYVLLVVVMCWRLKDHYYKTLCNCLHSWNSPVFLGVVAKRPKGHYKGSPSHLVLKWHPLSRPL